MLQGDVASSHTFYAKEELQFDITFSHDEQLPVSPRCKMNENGTNPGPGDLEAIWNSSASHLPQVEKQSAFPSESSTARVQGIENYIQGIFAFITYCDYHCYLVRWLVMRVLRGFARTKN